MFVFHMEFMSEIYLVRVQTLGVWSPRQTWRSDDDWWRTVMVSLRELVKKGSTFPLWYVLECFFVHQSSIRASSLVIKACITHWYIRCSTDWDKEFVSFNLIFIPALLHPTKVCCSIRQHALGNKICTFDLNLTPRIFTVLQWYVSAQTPWASF
jgi:hypothetical protein